MGITDYSSMEKDIRDAPQPYCIGKGKEVKARITRVMVGVSEKNDAHYVMPNFDVPAEPLAREFNDFFWDPTSYGKVEPKQVASSKAKFSNFVKAFGIDLSKPFDWETDIPGKEGWLITGSVQEDTGFGEKSSVSQYVTGPKSAGAAAPAAGGGDIPF